MSTRGAIDRPITYQGVWDSTLTYHPRMVVTYLNTMYMCVARNTNRQPSILLTTPWLPMGTSGAVVQSTVGAGLPTVVGRTQGDFHYNQTDQHEYVLVGSPNTQYAGDSLLGTAGVRLGGRTTPYGGLTWVTPGGDGLGPRYVDDTNVPPFPMGVSDSSHGNTALVTGYGGGSVLVSADFYLGGYSNQNPSVLYAGVGAGGTGAGVQWHEVTGLTVHYAGGDVVLPNPTGLGIDRVFSNGSWRSAMILVDFAFKTVSLYIGNVMKASWLLNPSLAIPDSGYSGFQCSVSQGSNVVRNFYLGNGNYPQWTPVWTDSIPATLVDAKGDLLVGTADNTIARHPVSGTNGRVLTEDSTAPRGVAWSALPASGIAVQDENATVASGVTQLDFQGAGVTAAAGTGEVVVTIPGPSAAYSAKGDLLVGTGAGATAILPVGTTGYVVTADPSTPTGLKWAAIATGGVTVRDESATIASGVTQLNFIGAGVTAAVGTGEVTVTIPGGSGVDTTALHYQGAWGSGTTYAVGDVVTKLYQLYVAIFPGAGADPTVPAGSSFTETAGTSMTVNGFWNTYTVAQQFTLTAPVSVDSLAYLCRTASTPNGNYRLGIATALGANEGAITWLVVGGVTCTVDMLASADPAIGSSAMRSGVLAGRVTIPAGTYYFVVKGTSGSGNQRAGINNIASASPMNVTIANNQIWTATAAGGAYTQQTTTSTIEFQLGTGGVSAWTKIADIVPTTVQVKSSAYTMLSTDAAVLASGTTTITLPTASTCKIGHPYIIKNVGTNTITLGGTIDGVVNKTLTVSMSSISIMTDGTSWYEV